MNMRRPADPPGYRRNALHHAIVAFNLLSDIPPLAISPALAGLAAIAAWPWEQTGLRIVAGMGVALPLLVDGISLSLLPRQGRSFGPVTPPLLALAFLRAGFTLILGVLWPTVAALAVATGTQLAITVAQIYATWVEPFHLKVTQAHLQSDKLDHERPLRVLHISDLHFERWSPRERDLIRTVEHLAPDAILLTGDYLNLSSVVDPEAHAGAREVLAAIAATAPTYAITGSPPVDLAQVVPRIFDGLPITWLDDEIADLHLNGHQLRLVGLRCTRDREQDVPRLNRTLPEGADGTFTLLLYHSPDLMPEAVEKNVDLYLAGHTHGGQLRFPIFGALFTSSDFWKRYEAGRYDEGNTTLYVSRGLGMEGLGAPRARFLAPPEIILWHLSGDQDGGDFGGLCETTSPARPQSKTSEV
jgi:hypothetical protein